MFTFFGANATKRARADADAARDKGDWRAAAEGYRRFLKHRPRAADIWVQYGHALKEIQNFQDAETAYEKALALAPDVADTHVMLGHLKKITNRLDQAASHYEQAAALDPEGLDPLLQLAFTEKDLGRTASALAHFRTAQKLAPDDREVASMIQRLSAPVPKPRAATSSGALTDGKAKELESALKAMALEVKRQKDRNDRMEASIRDVSTALAVLENDLRSGRIEIERRLIQVEAQSPEVGARFQMLIDHVRDLQAKEA